MKHSSNPVGRTLIRLLASMCVICVTACEAPLTMEGVEQAMQQPIHRTDRFQASARNGDNVVVVGNQGVIVYSADAGETWQRVELPDWPALIDVAPCPNGDFVALAFAPLVYVSSDAGATWTARPIPTEESPQALTCAPDNGIWVVGAFTYRWNSDDRGVTWNESTNDEDALLTSIQFLDESNAFIIGEFGTVMKTADGGENWETLAPIADEFYPQTAHFSNMTEGWLGGLGGVILHTADGGATWNPEETEVEVPIYGLESVNGELYAVGGEGTLLKRVAGVWRRVDHGLPIRLYIRAIRDVGGNRALMAGVAGTLHVLPLDGA